LGKLKLDLGGLEVQTFEAGSDAMAKRKDGTVQGNELTVTHCPNPTSDASTCKYPTLAQDCCVAGWTDNDPECNQLRFPTYWCSSETQPGACS
jgi:hypothetical protein